jgi:hypothetical protein
MRGSGEQGEGGRNGATEIWGEKREETDRKYSRSHRKKAEGEKREDVERRPDVRGRFGGVWEFGTLGHFGTLWLVGQSRMFLFSVNSHNPIVPSLGPRSVYRGKNMD